MKKLICTLTGVCLLATLFLQSISTFAACDTTAKTSSTATGSAQIRFRKVMTNYPSSGKSTWFYTLKSGNRPAISHIIIGVGICVGVTEMGTWSTYNKSGWSSQSLQSKSIDPTCGLYGIKFDNGFNDNESRNYYIVVNGNYTANESGSISIKASTKCSNVTVCTPACAALPVSLINFESKTEGNTVALNWNTASEKNNSHFILEKSNTGSTLVEEMAVINGAGNANEINTYNFTAHNLSIGSYPPFAGRYGWRYLGNWYQPHINRRPK